MNYKKIMYQFLCTSVLCTMPLSAHNNENEPQAEHKEERVTNAFNPSNTSHPSSNHIYIGRTKYFDQIELEDGSFWNVCPEHQELLHDWYEGDPIAITQAQKRWFGDHTDIYPFAIYNRKLDTYVDAKVSAEPIYNSFYRRWIFDINKVYGNSFVILNDGTFWPLYESDRYTWEIWTPGDSIIIGTNNAFFSWGNPNLLINVTCSSTYVVGKRQK